MHTGVSLIAFWYMIAMLAGIVGLFIVLLWDRGGGK